MKTKTVLIDLDDTIVELVPYLINICNSMLNLNLTVNDWKSYSVYEVYGIGQEEYFDLCIKNKILENCPPIVLAKQAIDHLVNIGYTPTYMTARAWYPQGYEVSHNWLSRWAFPYCDNLHVVGLKESKADYISSHGMHFDLAFDDNGHHITQFLERKVVDKVVLIDNPWNWSYNNLDQYRTKHIYNVVTRPELLDLNSI